MKRFPFTATCRSCRQSSASNVRTLGILCLTFCVSLTFILWNPAVWQGSIGSRIVRLQTFRCEHKNQQSPVTINHSLEPVYITHCFWRGNARNPHTTMLLTSFVATQPNISKMMIWTDDDTNKLNADQFIESVLQSVDVDTDSEELFAFTQRLKRRISVHPIDSLLRKNGFLNETEFTRNVDPTALSDLVRMNVLNEFGGIYVDVDTIFLRDISVLERRIGFAYPWSLMLTKCPSSKRTQMLNTAPMGMRKNSQLSRFVLERIRQRSTSIEEASKAAHPGRFTCDVQGFGGFDIVPIQLVDPLWIWADGWCTEFNGIVPTKKKRFEWLLETADLDIDLYRLFPSAMMYHNHLSVSSIIPNGSYYALYLNQFRDRMYRVLGGASVPLDPGHGE